MKEKSLNEIRDLGLDVVFFICALGVPIMLILMLLSHFTH